jgi:hypothetical protein
MNFAEIQQLSGAISGVVFFAAYVRYMLAVISGKSKPVIISWVLWGVIDIVAIVSMYSAGVVSMQMIGSVVGSIGVMIVAIMYGEKHSWNFFDYVCLVLVIVSLAAWYFVPNPVVGLVLSQISVLTASVPTFISAWKNPEQEDVLSWAMFFGSCVFAIIAINKGTLENIMQPIIFTIIESTMVYLVCIRPYSKKYRELLVA